MRLSVVGRLAAVLFLPLLLSGCELLFPGFYSYGSTEFPLDPSFGPDTSYTTGSASLDLTQDGNTQRVDLGELLPGAGTLEGATSATWKNEDGWSLSIMNFGDFGLPEDPYSAVVTIQQVNDHEVWIADTMTNSSCTTNVQESSADRFAGASTCRQLRWADGSAAPGGFGMGSPPYIAGQDPFDVSITFEAKR